MKDFLSGHELGAALVKAGVVPDLTRNILIEIPLNGAVTIHLDYYADHRLLDVLPAKAQGAQIVDHTKDDDDDKRV